MVKNFKQSIMGISVAVTFDLDVANQLNPITNISIESTADTGIAKQPTLELYNDQWTLVNNHYKVESNLVADDKEYLTHHAIANGIVERMIEIAEQEKLNTNN